MSRVATIASLAIVIAGAALYLVTTQGCLVNSPGWPERDGAKLLQNRGYESASIERVVQGRKLDDKQILELEAIRNPNVQFLLARNPNLSAARMRKLARHKDDFIRSGLAHNPGLPADVVKTLLEDTSHTVWVGLAANPSLDAATLLALKNSKNLDWSWFAMNPACPAEIVQKIQAAGDKNGLYWLKRTQESLRGWPIEQPRG